MRLSQVLQTIANHAMILEPLMRFRAFTAVLMAGVAIALTIAPATSALTIRQSNGRPGKVVMAAIQGVAANDVAPQIVNPLLKTGGIYRSPASRVAQKICIRFRIWSSDPTATTWKVVSTWRSDCAWAKRGRRMRPRAHSAQVEALKRYRVTAVITWRTRKRLLASEVLDYDKTGDYYCGTNRCSIDQTDNGRAFLYFLS